jgi:ElaB/YqjD/DUF883 family membrane-anchored ribosome-binding protein
MFKRKPKSKLTDTAERVGKGLGRIAARLDSWKAERDLIAAEIQTFVSTGQQMLSDLGHSAQDASVELRSAGAGLAKVRRKLSIKARKAISDAQKTRWALQKAAKKK